ncbi:MAG: DUF3040 domain-containing protein [Candidatus Bathyarchaeota archaeon]|jgi:hypothetical protein
MSSKDEESDIQNRLERMENQLEAIEGSLASLVQDAERRTDRRESALLVIGVVLGGLVGICVNLWTDFYMMTIPPVIDITFLVFFGIVSISLVALFVYLLWWARNRLR